MMYADWTEARLATLDASVLCCFSEPTGKHVAAVIVKELARSVNIERDSAVASVLTSDEQVQWVMQVICFGLGLSFSTDYETIRDCVKLYSSWLTCIRAEPQLTVPKPIIDRPLWYADQIINQFHHLFLPRNETGDNSTIMRQAKEAHYVLRCLQSLVMQSRVELQDELWPVVLRFVLTINDSLLSIPFEPDDISVQLCSRVLEVLFELWLYACGNGQFPSPSFWKSFQSLCKQWRHRVALIDQWAQTILVLTGRLLNDLRGEKFCQLTLTEDQTRLLPPGIPSEILRQAWLRFLYLLGNPAEIPFPSAFDSSPKFREFVSRYGGQHGIVEPSEHPCLNQLPFCFFRAVCAIGNLVGVFLGEQVDCSFPGPEKLMKEWNPVSFQSPGHHQVPSVTSTPAGTSGLMSLGKKSTKDTASKTANTKISLSHLPPSCLVYGCMKARSLVPCLEPLRNSDGLDVDRILDIFGEWLYSAASVKVHSSNTPEDAVSLVSVGSQSESEGSGGLAKSNSQSDVLSKTSAAVELHGVSGIQAGKAGAVGTLCRVFCSKLTNGAISELHKVKFFSVLLDCLVQKESIVPSSLICNGANLCRVDLRGVELLVPNLLSAIEYVIIDSDRTKLHPSVKENEVRKACLWHCAAMVGLPTHYGASSISDLNRSTERHTFIGLRPKILRILIYILKNETDACNLQLALGLSSAFCMESWIWERKTKAKFSEGYCLQAVLSVLTTVCEQLCSRWTGENAVSVAALDCLYSLAFLCETHVSDERAVYLLLVSSLCQFIEHQLSRPPPFHSRDLHSTVVNALICLQVWITAVPWLMEQEECLYQVTETIELGIFGAKGQPMSSSFSKKPASQRVHDAAEQLLYCLFCRVNSNFAPVNEVEDESAILKSVSGLKEECGKFRYFLVDNSAIIGLLELTSFGLEPEGFPSVAVVVRSPYYGIRSWKFTLRPRTPGKPRPFDWVDRPEGVDCRRCPRPSTAHFPAEVEKISKCKADSSIPPFRVSPEAEKLRPLIREAIQMEKSASAKADAGQTSDIKPPPPAVDCHIGRILLEDLGFLNYDKIAVDCVMLDSAKPEFFDEMKRNVDDSLSRVVQTVHIFYVRKGQNTATEILENGACIEKTNSAFCRMLSKLGKVLGTAKARVWTGHWATAFAKHNPNAVAERVKEDGDTYFLDGVKYFIYWSTALVDVAFLVPNNQSQKVLSQLCHQKSPSIQIENAATKQGQGQNDMPPPVPVRPPRSKSVSHESEIAGVIKGANLDGQSSSKSRRPQVFQDYRILIVWLEHYEDHSSFPLQDLLVATDTGEGSARPTLDTTFILYVFRMSTGLCRIKMSGPWGKLGFSGPLVDGVVVSELFLSTAIQQSVICIGRRRSLEQEGYLLPHIRRKQKIQEFGNKYKKKMSPCDFLTELLVS